MFWPERLTIISFSSRKAVFFEPPARRDRRRHRLRRGCVVRLLEEKNQPAPPPPPSSSTAAAAMMMSFFLDRPWRAAPSAGAAAGAAASAASVLRLLGHLAETVPFSRSVRSTHGTSPLSRASPLHRVNEGLNAGRAAAFSAGSKAHSGASRGPRYPLIHDQPQAV